MRLVDTGLENQQIQMEKWKKLKRVVLGLLHPEENTGVFF